MLLMMTISQIYSDRCTLERLFNRNNSQEEIEAKHAAAEERKKVITNANICVWISMPFYMS